MTRIQKLIDRIRSRPVEADFDDVERLLRHFDWTLDRESGSHVTFVKSGEYPIVVPKKGGRKVKGRYLDKICERLRLDEINEQ
jgi:predicted RNA binding protein YcfA (HicA-like mRNA interferase family)